MIVRIKGRFFVRNHIWFEDVSDLNTIFRDLDKCDEVIIHGNPIFISGKKICVEKQLSLITDLKKNENDLLNDMTKTIRNEILRAQRENVICRFYGSTDIVEDNTLMNGFAETYEKMYEAKNMDNQQLNRNELIGYAKNRRLLISTASIKEEIMVYHSYVFDDNDCRLLYSCSDFRNLDNSIRNAVGRANKYLHWKDMLYFKEIGLKKYDWGGVSSFDKPNGIDVFKSAFGGERISYYNIRVPMSLGMNFYRFCSKNI